MRGHVVAWPPATLLLLCALTSPVRADPLALRAPFPTSREARGVVAVVGWPDASLAWMPRPGLGVALEYRLPSDAAGVAVAWRRVLAEGGRLSLAVVAGGGVKLPLIRAGLALTGQLALVGALRAGRFTGALSLASPCALRVVPDVETRLPLLLELWLTVRAGPLSIGLQGGAGATFSVGNAAQLALQGSLVVAVPFDR